VFLHDVYSFLLWFSNSSMCYRIGLSVSYRQENLMPHKFLHVFWLRYWLLLSGRMKEIWSLASKKKASFFVSPRVLVKWDTSVKERQIAVAKQLPRHSSKAWNVSCRRFHIKGRNVEELLCTVTNSEELLCTWASLHRASMLFSLNWVWIICRQNYYELTDIEVSWR